MSTSATRVGILPAFSMIVLSVGLMNHVIVIPLLLGASHRDAWLAVLLLIPPTALWVALLVRIIARLRGRELTDVIRERCGAAADRTFRALSALVLLAIGAATLRDTATWSVSTYLPQTPILVIGGLMVCLCAVCAACGIRTLSITSSVLLPMVVGLGYFVMLANMKYKDYSLLLPLLENGWQPVVRGAGYAAAGLAELSLLLLFQHRVKGKLGYVRLLLLALFLIGLTVGPTVGSIAEFGPFEAAKQRDPAYEQWRMVKIGKFIEHVDFLSIFQWLAGSFARIALSLYLISRLLAAKAGRKRRALFLLLAFLMLLGTVMPVSDVQFTQFVSRILVPLELVYGCAVTLWLSVVLRQQRPRRRRHAD